MADVREPVDNAGIDQSTRTGAESGFAFVVAIRDRHEIDPHRREYSSMLDSTQRWNILPVT
jgi:hypothetical protein